MLRALVITAAALLPAPLAAQTATGIWTLDDEAVRAPLAHIAFPRTIGGMALTETKEFSHAGEKLDNVAEYRSADGAIWGTIYIYRPGYPDAAIAAYATEHGMTQVYGPGLRRLSQATAAIGGVAGAAIRDSFTGGILKDSGPLASAAGFARVGGWIVKLRVSGPAARQPEVEATLDAMLAAARFEDKAVPFQVAPLRFAAPCPAAASGTVALIPQPKEIAPDTLGVAMALAAEGSVEGKPGEKVAPAFPANGATPVCVRGSVGLGGPALDVLQAADTSQPETVLVVLNDLDDVVAVRKHFVGKGYSIVKSDIGGGSVLGAIDRLPDAQQFERVFHGEPAGVLAVSAKVAMSAEGKTNITLASSGK